MKQKQSAHPSAQHNKQWNPDIQHSDNRDLDRIPVLPLGITDRPFARMGTGEDRDLASAVITEPLDALGACPLSVLEHLRQLRHCALRATATDRRAQRVANDATLILAVGAVP